jgi:hypothetical protein
VWNKTDTWMEWFAIDESGDKDFLVIRSGAEPWVHTMVSGGTHWNNFLILPRVQFRLL